MVAKPYRLQNAVGASTQAKPELRVLQVFSSLAMGGAETWLMALLKYFRDAAEELPFRVQTDVLLTGGTRDKFDDEARELGAALFYPQFTRKRSLTFAREFRRILINGRYHAIHDHQDYSAGLRFVMGIGLLPAVRVAHVHNTAYSIAGYRTSVARRATFALAKLALARTATHITSTSKQMLEEFGIEDALFSRVSRQVVHCGFDTSAFKGDNQASQYQLKTEFGWPADSKLILFVGRLDEPVGNGLHRKNPIFALEVAKACIEQDSTVRMIMAGSGEQMRRDLEAKVQNWGLSEKIRLTGIYPDVTRLMRGSDLFLFPSLAEGLGMVVVEAQAAGLRVLTSEGVPKESLVIPGMVEFHALETGVSAWAGHARRLLNTKTAHPLTCNLAVQNSPYSIENSARALLSIYSECITAN
jgi:glycosyltransferase involved in cell wall biosynthesis